jgi:hypothetical protein
MAEKAKKLCALNNLGHRLKVTLVGPPPLPKQIEENWSGRFGLIVINLSPYQTVKRLKKISSHFESIRGRLIISGLHRGGQITFVLKAATRNGLALIESAAEDEDWATLTLATRRFQDVPVQKWQPGDWVTHLTQDEMEILDEVDRADSAPNEPSPNDEPQNAQT